MFINPTYLTNEMFSRRPPPPSQVLNRLRPIVPLLGGTIIISIVETHRPAQSNSSPTRTPQKRAIARLQQKTKLGGAKPSDEVEGLRFMVHWEPTKGALGVLIPSDQLVLSRDALQVVSQRTTSYIIIFHTTPGCRETGFRVDASYCHPKTFGSHFHDFSDPASA